MHDYLKKAQTMLEPPKGDFTAFIQRLQQNRLAALSPDMFAEGDDALTPGRIIARSNQRAREKLFGGQRGKAAPTMAQPSPGQVTSGALRAPANVSRPRRTNPVKSISTGAGPLESTQRRERNKNQGSAAGLFIALPLFVAFITFFQFGDPGITAVSVFLTAFLVIVIAGVMRRNQRRRR